MKTVKTLITILTLSFSCHAQSDSLLIKKWFYCDSVTEPNELTKMLFYADSKETECEPTKYVFFWEFKMNGEYIWSDTLRNSQSNKIDGTEWTTSEKWRIEKDVLYVGRNIFIIDVLSGNRLLIHRREE